MQYTVSPSGFQRLSSTARVANVQLLGPPFAGLVLVCEVDCPRLRLYHGTTLQLVHDLDLASGRPLSKGET